MVECITITVPKEVAEKLKIPPDECERRLRIELALRLYEKGIATLGLALKIAKIPLWEFLDILEREKIPRHYDEEEAFHDLKMVNKIESGLKCERFDNLFENKSC